MKYCHPKHSFQLRRIELMPYCAVFVVLCMCSVAVETAQSWPYYRQNAQNNAYVAVKGVASPTFCAVWENADAVQHPPAGYYGGAVMDSVNGILYENHQGFVNAFNLTNGQPLFVAEKYEVTTPIVVASDSAVMFGSGYDLVSVSANANSALSYSVSTLQTDGFVFVTSPMEYVPENATQSHRVVIGGRGGVACFSVPSQDATVLWRATNLTDQSNTECLLREPADMVLNQNRLYYPCGDTIYSFDVVSGAQEVILLTPTAESGDSINSDLVYHQGLLWWVTQNGVLQAMNKSGAIVVEMPVTGDSRLNYPSVQPPPVFAGDLVWVGLNPIVMLSGLQSPLLQLSIVWKRMMSNYGGFTVDLDFNVYVATPNEGLWIIATNNSTLSHSAISTIPVSSVLLDAEGNVVGYGGKYKTGVSCYNDCSGPSHGVCNGCFGNCTCIGEWSGGDCSLQQGCYSRGTWNNATQACSCDSGYSGAHCEQVDGTSPMSKDYSVVLVASITIGFGAILAVVLGFAGVMYWRLLYKNTKRSGGNVSPYGP